MEISRRRFIAAGLCGCALCGSGRALARIAPNTLQPLVEPGYQPLDADEKGLWQLCERLEEEISTSNLLMKTPDLRHYALGVLERLMGEQARDVRVYLVHDASFNASMAPNGMMLVHSGFLARVRNEAQFAAVLGHEGGHYARKHSVEGWRDQRTKTGFMAFVSAGTAVAVGATASAGGTSDSWVDLARSLNTALFLSIFSFSRRQESEADLYGLKLLETAGYAPEAASQVWRQLIEERKASARQRGKRYRDDARSAFSTHPPSGERMGALRAAAGDIRQASAGRQFDDGREAWAKAIAPHRAMLLAEQVKLNDPGASLYLLNSLGEDGWTGTLRYYEGEVYRLRDEAGDAERAANAYAAAVQHGDAPAEAWRAHGYALLKAGRGEEGRAALVRYLGLAPDARDAAMVRFSIAQ
ncbi:M48 family metallopeptidase [Pedomonas mirosovicensis]|uniref:M48 family metallopeptidase n=1 Tax=Pedomonas mirosovicensis TaxID=2908641 RepID=UPI00216A0EB8|nr:M48 family metallopeptidase [Pedomonas mirosovicensis]MCH8685972.1 M48 family metalloprotease [Pedomonas mirosovicensis]